ncbi:MAG: hypothetical protein ACM3MF_07600 [Anaerolineae bacterium]
MLNPFLQPIRPQKPHRTSAAAEEAAAQMIGHSLDTASPHPSVGLLVGRLLIRMGEHLAHQNHELKDLKEHA